MSVTMMEEVEVVAEERAKKLGLTLISEVAGPDAVRVTLEFEKQGELKGYGRIAIEQFEGDKLLLSAILKEGDAKSGRVIVGFRASRINLATLSLRIVVTMDPSGSRVGYVLRMKDFVEQ
jgi:hypothetical protein